MSEKIKFAVVGCGHIGKRHAEMISRNEECELVGLIDVKDKSVLGIESYDVPFFTSLDEFLASGIEVDVINIASPNGFHFEQSYKVIDAGKHVVIEFGSQSNMLSYMLATNMITRRIHANYVKKAEYFLQTKNPVDRPQQLVITIEEAHRFLDSAVVHQTIFGTIAREMRKYFVTLLIVDQRPSGIDNEVMSQVGTRITCLLNDEKDIEAIFTGVSGGGSLRSVLAKLDSKQQALVLGHAVPMPVVIRTRAYDQKFYAEIGATDWRELPDEEVLAAAKIAKADLGF